MKTLKRILIVAIAGGMMVHAVQAIPLTGSVTFAGGVTLDTGSAATATAVTGWDGPGGAGTMPIVISASGDFVLLAPLFSAVTFTSPYVLDTAVPHPTLWSTVNGAVLDLTFSTITSQGVGPGGAFVTAGGMGVLTALGFDPTPGTWSFSTQDPSAGTPPLFSFSASSGAVVPDGGTTLILLGAALSALGLIGRKLKP